MIIFLNLLVILGMNDVSIIYPYRRKKNRCVFFVERGGYRLQVNQLGYHYWTFSLSLGDRSG
jgi:hypothetical protein